MPRRSKAPGTTWALPAVPLAMGTTRPWPGTPEETPTASQVVVPVQATFVRFAVPGTCWTLPAVPLTMGTTTPEIYELFWPTATQALALAQAAPRRNPVPGTTWTLPGAPLTMGTTTPWSAEEFVPTTSQVVALRQTTPVRCCAPGTGWMAVPANAGTTPPSTATGTASADTRNIAARRNRQDPLRAWRRTPTPGWSPIIDALPAIIVGTPHARQIPQRDAACREESQADAPYNRHHRSASRTVTTTNHVHPAEGLPSPSGVAEHPTRCWLPLLAGASPIACDARRRRN